MTQAFNLAQLANNLNTSGQLDASDGLSGTLPVANGGTGRSTLTANNLVVGNGTSGVNFVAPGTNGNVLLSNGSSWTSASINTVPGFNNSLGTSGWQRLPGGLLIAWGEKYIGNIGSDYYDSYVFPVAFTTIYQVFGTLFDSAAVPPNGGGDCIIVISSQSTTGCDFSVQEFGGVGQNITAKFLMFGT